MSNPYKDPTHEILFDLTWAYALWHDKRKEQVMYELWDSKGGSRGIFEWLYEQAVRFQIWWDELPEDAPERECYFEEIDEWLITELDTLLNEEE